MAVRFYSTLLTKQVMAMNVEPANIEVLVQTEYLPEQSSPEDNRFVFAYHIAITNYGHSSAQLLNRHWIITDGNQRIREVQGEGVVGQQPLILPGETYTYSSGTLMETSVGSMHGYYEMIDARGKIFKAIIPPFTLALPNHLH